MIRKEYTILYFLLFFVSSAILITARLYAGKFIFGSFSIAKSDYDNFTVFLGYFLVFISISSFFFTVLCLFAKDR